MFNPKQLARLLSTLRRKHRISLNQLARAVGISRRTLARLENVPRPLCSVPREQRSSRKVPGTKHASTPLSAGKVPPPGISARTAYKLAKALLGPDATQRALDDATRLSRFLGPDPLYKYLDVLYHYPAFLFHDSPEQRALRDEFGEDYQHSLDLLLRSGFGTRNLGARLRAFRLQRDLTLVETADLLGLSKSELHRLERSERLPSPRTRYRILRLLTLPIGVNPCASVVPSLESSDPLARLRHIWLAGPLKTKELAASLGVSQPHLIRLLRGDRRPSKKLKEALRALTARL